jgi:hypothetical protein
MTTQPAIKVQNWGDSLRLPCFQNAADFAELVTSLDGFRKPPVPLQSKHIPALKRNTWYVLRRPSDRVRSGLICVWPRYKCCVYISGDLRPRVALLRLRVDPQFFSAPGLTVFAATLSPAARRLWIEDVYLWKGRNVFAEETFRARIQLVDQWLEHYCILDAQLLDGLELEGARWEALDRLKPEGVWDLQTDEEGFRRLFWNAHYTPPTQEVPVTPRPMAPKINEGPLVALASREPGPDQWALTTAEGDGLGRALIRKLDVSTALRGSKEKTVHLEVAWRSTFGKWEAIGLSTALVSGRENFAAAK